MGLINEEKPPCENKKPVHVTIKNTADYQRLKLDKLMRNIEKPVVIPERPKERNSPHVPDFVRNVMGSSAGAGSGEFHVYRHLRRKEYARQKYMQIKAEKERKDDEYREKLTENQRLAEERTAKKRARRLKKKQARKTKKPKLEKDSLNTKENASEESDSVDEMEIKSTPIETEEETVDTKNHCENELEATESKNANGNEGDSSSGNTEVAESKQDKENSN